MTIPVSGPLAMVDQLTSLIFLVTEVFRLLDKNPFKKMVHACKMAY